MDEGIREGLLGGHRVSQDCIDAQADGAEITIAPMCKSPSFAYLFTCYSNDSLLLFPGTCGVFLLC